MTNEKNYSKVSVLIVGAGPAGLSAAIHLKTLEPDMDICVIEKAESLGNHNLSGAVLEPKAVNNLLDSAIDKWSETDQAKDVLGQKIETDDIMFFAGKNFSMNIYPAIGIAKKLGLSLGQMAHKGDYVISISKLTKWFAKMAQQLGVEVMTGFSAQDIIYNADNGTVTGVKLIQQGLDKHGKPQPNYMQAETINCDYVLLAEGCDGLLTEKFVEKVGLKRRSNQLYSVGVKEIIKVSDQQYTSFTSGRVVHAMGYPIWTPVLGPAMFGGGIMYPCGENHIAVGMIVGLDWKYRNFNPQDALTLFKGHKFVKQFIEGGEIVEAGAKMIPEGGYHAIPRDQATGSIGKNNCAILGDSAGFVNMLKIKGLHNAIESGIKAATAIKQSKDNPSATATKYTAMVEDSDIGKEMRSAKNFRQTIAKFGELIGFALSIFSNFMPRFNIEEDYKEMKQKDYKLAPKKSFDKDNFTAMAATHHREEQPCHLEIFNKNLCAQKCKINFDNPCIKFCPAGVYEIISDNVKAANPSNCLHCKTCQRKCPFDNIRWTVPEGDGGPRYKRM